MAQRIWPSGFTCVSFWAILNEMPQILDEGPARMPSFFVYYILAWLMRLLYDVHLHLSADIGLGLYIGTLEGYSSVDAFLDATVRFINKFVLIQHQKMNYTTSL